MKAQEEYNIYIVLKNNYRKDLLVAKRSACEAYIGKSSNKCKASWDIITQENTRRHTHDVALDPDTLNRYFRDTIDKLTNQVSNNPILASNYLGSSIFLEDTCFSWRLITMDEETY